MFDANGNIKLVNGYIIDGDGFWTGDTVVVVEGTDTSDNIITVTPDYLTPYFKLKWNGDKWGEGETDEERAERESNELVQSLIPTQEELFNADLEIKTLTLLMDMGVI